MASLCIGTASRKAVPANVVADLSTALASVSAWAVYLPFLRCHPHHHDPMRRYGGLIAPGEFALVLVLPQIADLGAQMAGVSDFLPFHGNLAFCASAIEQNHRATTVI